MSEMPGLRRGQYDAEISREPETGLAENCLAYGKPCSEDGCGWWDMDGERCTRPAGALPMAAQKPEWVQWAKGESLVSEPQFVLVPYGKNRLYIQVSLVTAVAFGPKEASLYMGSLVSEHCWTFTEPEAITALKALVGAE